MGHLLNKLFSKQPIKEAKCSYKTITQVLGGPKRVPHMYQRRRMTTREVGIAGQADRCQLLAHADLGLAQGPLQTTYMPSLSRPGLLRGKIFISFTTF